MLKGRQSWPLPYHKERGSAGQHNRWFLQENPTTELVSLFCTTTLIRCSALEPLSWFGQMRGKLPSRPRLHLCIHNRSPFTSFTHKNSSLLLIYSSWILRSLHIRDLSFHSLTSLTSDLIIFFTKCSFATPSSCTHHCNTPYSNRPDKSLSIPVLRRTLSFVAPSIRVIPYILFRHLISITLNLLFSTALILYIASQYPQSVPLLFHITPSLHQFQTISIKALLSFLWTYFLLHSL